MRGTSHPQTATQRPRTGGKVFVERAQVLDDLIADVQSSPRTRRFIRTVVNEQPVSQHDTIRRKSPTRAFTTPLAADVDLKKAKRDENPHAEALAHQRERRDREFPAMLSRVDRATRFLDDIDREMQLNEEARRNKIRRQFEEWNANVHGEIQRKIQSAVGSMDAKTLNRRKNEDYKKFLNVTNRKPAIFRDIIIESEYDPLEPNRRTVRAQTSLLNDPVKISEIKARKEGSMLGSSAKGVLQQRPPLGKDTLNVELWASGKIESTPYGTFAKMMSTTGGSPSHTKEAKSLTMQSHIHFDHFSFPRGRAAIDAEMPRGKRIYPEPVFADPGRVFGGLPEDVLKELATIRPPENRRPF